LNHGQAVESANATVSDLFRFVFPRLDAHIKSIGRVLDPVNPVLGEHMLMVYVIAPILIPTTQEVEIEARAAILD
jgi:hypothetical protein